MLFAHGFGYDQNMRRFVALAFEPNYRVVLFDYVDAENPTSPRTNQRATGTWTGASERVEQRVTKTSEPDRPCLPLPASARRHPEFCAPREWSNEHRAPGRTDHRRHERAEALLLFRIEEAGIHYDRSRRAPDHVVRADPDRLQQIILNLLTNAALSSPSRTVTSWSNALLTIANSCCTGATTAAVYRKTNSTRFSSPSYNCDEAYARTSQQDAGLGLAISRQLECREPRWVRCWGSAGRGCLA